MRQYGFSLIEILIALSIGLVLLSELSQVYLSLKKQYLQQQQVAEVQEKARLLVSYFRYRIHMAGYKGCLDRSFNSDPANKNKMEVYDDAQSFNQFHIKIKPKTQLLKLSGCRYYQGKEEWVDALYYVAQSSQKPVYSLFEKISIGNRQALVEGVDNFFVDINNTLATISFSFSTFPPWVFSVRSNNV